VRLPALVAIGLVITGPVLAGPFEDAKAAYQRGDYATALRLWRPLANDGDANAQFWMGAAYDLGHGVRADYGAASIWYRKAADQVNAQFNLAHMYEQGQGVPRAYSLQAAASWYRRAADQGYRAAQGNLGILLATAHGVRRDYVQAYKWFALAGETANRDFVAAHMTAQQVDEAEALVRAWQARPER
jgi:hypothetical protein